MDREKIIVVERPEYISWDEISSVLKRAHRENVEKGIVLPYPQLPPDVLEAKTEGRGGKMLVALYEGKVIGTGAIAVIEKHFWCGKGEYAYCFLDAVLPEFSGKGVFRKIEAEQAKYAQSKGVTRLLLDTDERNKRMLDISKRNGYRLVEYRVKNGRNSVVLVKWLDGCPYSRIKCMIQYARIKRRKKKGIK